MAASDEVRIDLSSRMESARIDALGVTDPEQKAYWHGRADGYQDSIDVLNQEMVGRADGRPSRGVAVSRYRKKPIVIEAAQFDGTPESGAALVAWATEQGAEAEYHPFLADHFKGDPKVYVAHPDPYMRIVTLEGTMIVSKDDWIIKGVKGEFYPCKPDIFETTYEPVPPNFGEVA